MWLALGVMLRPNTNIFGIRSRDIEHQTRRLSQDVTTDIGARPEIRKACRSHASDSPVPGEGESGCLFDEI
jgi:hypothetical protein